MIFLSRMLAITRGHRGLLSIAVIGSVLYTALSVLPALIIRQLQRLSMGYHTRQQSGTVAAKVIGDVETIEFFTAHAGIQLISAATVPLLIGIVMLLVNWQLALVALAPLLLILVILVAFRR